MSTEISINSYLSDPDSSNLTDPSTIALVRTVDKNNFVQAAITSYDREDMKNDTLWEQFRKNFAEWTEDDFKIDVLNIRLRRLRNALRKRDVWVLKDSKMIIAKFSIQILEKEHSTLWIEAEIVSSAEKFESDVIDHLRKIDFDRNSIDYSWQTQSRFESRKSESSFRERSIQSSIQSLNKEKVSIRQRFSSQSVRQQFLELIRQRSSLSQSIKQRSSSFQSLNRQQSLSIELQNVQSIDQQFNRWDSSIKSFVLKKSRRSTSLRSFIESSSRSIFAFLILSSSSSFSSPSISRRALSSHLFRSSTLIESIKSIEAMRTESEHEKELANLAKLYTNEAKYSDENDSFSFKLTIFHDMCDRANVSQSAKLKAFSIMLKGLILDYYYSNMSTDTLIIFDEVCFSMRNYFEDAEYRRSILSKWNNLTLKSIMIKSENENKFIEKCLQLLIKDLRHLQHDLNSELRSEKFIHNKLINACQDVFVCQYVCFKLSDSLIDLINDLRSSIIIYQKVNSANFFETFETFFTDRRYHKNFSSRIDNFSFRVNQNRRFQNRRFQNRRFQNRSKRKCFVCQKEECWFIKHSKDEREIVKQKFKNRFFNQMNKRIDQYIFEYEETNLSSSYSENDSDTDLIDEMKTLIVNLSALSLISDNSANTETFIISFESVKNAEMMITNLVNRSLNHFLINNLHICMNDDQTSDVLQTDLKNFSLIDLNAFIFVHICMKNIDLFTYIIIDRYTFEMFYDIMIDSRASVRSIVDYEQYLAFIKNTFIDLNRTKTDAVNVQFEIESISSVESLTIDISLRLMKFHVIKANTSFLLSLVDMNRLKVYFNNIENILFMIIKNRNLSVIRRFDHDFLLWKNSYSLHSYIVQSFNFNLCYLIDVELRQSHRRFDHSSILKLHVLLERSDHEIEKATLKKLTKFCTFCQKYAKSSERFKFILKNDVNFNYSIIVDVMYIENHLILHVIDEITRFQVVKWLQNISAKHIWNMLRLCWIDVYLDFFDHILTDADKNFVSRKFRQFVISMTIIIKTVSIEAHWSIDVVKRYHAELRRAYQMIFENLDVNKKIALQMIVKAINHTVDSDELMFILLIFETYFRMHVMNSPTSSITQRAMTIEKAMIEIRKFRVERQIVDALNTWNDSIVTSIHNLSLNSDVLVWRESNVNQRDKWIESFKLLDIENETCKIVLSSESIDFRSTVIKSFLIESINDVESTNEIQLISEIEDTQSSDHQNNLSAATFEITRSVAIIKSFAIIRSTRARRLSLRYQNFADIIVFLQDDDSHSNQFECLSSSVLTSIFA